MFVGAVEDREVIELQVDVFAATGEAAFAADDFAVIAGVVRVVTGRLGRPGDKVDGCLLYTSPSPRD